jgi:biopolymer transport protein ExbD
MAIPPRRWVGYTLLTTGLLLQFDTYTFLQTHKSPLRVPLDAASEFALGYVLVPVGIAILLWPWISGLVEDIAPDASMKLSESLQNHSVEWRRQRRLPLKKRLVVLPNRGLVGGSAVLLVLLPMYLMLEKPDSRGIYVAINAGSGYTSDDTCWAGPIVVWVRQNGAAAQLFLNGSEIKREDLAPALRSRLAARANWEVFVEADDSVSYSEAMDAIDQITALHAKSVMLTPKLRRKLAEECPFR